jgi:hypothetical protein
MSGQTLEEMSELNRFNFEMYIANGRSQESILIIFRKTKPEMDIWCRQTYGLGFDDSYAWILNLAQGQYAELLSKFSEEGHKSALTTMTEVLLNVQADKVQKIQIVSDMDENDN